MFISQNIVKVYTYHVYTAQNFDSRKTLMKFLIESLVSFIRCLKALSTQAFFAVGDSYIISICAYIKFGKL